MRIGFITGCGISAVVLLYHGLRAIGFGQDLIAIILLGIVGILFLAMYNAIR